MRGSLRVSVFAASVLVAASHVPAQAPAAAEADLRVGKGFIATPVFTAPEDRALLALFEGLLVADVTDGMDAMGLQNVGLMDPEVRPLWKDTQDYKHRFIGIAVTARYVPTQRAAAGKRPIEEYDKWSGDWYNTLSPEPFQDLIRPGTALVIDDAERADVGSIGSNNIMAWKLRGAVGVVTDATARDTDEIATEKMPLYFRRPVRGIRRPRPETAAATRPLACPGARLIPADVSVARVGPSATSLPSDSSSTRSAMRKACSGWCVETSTPMPAPLSRAISSSTRDWLP